MHVVLATPAPVGGDGGVWWLVPGSCGSDGDAGGTGITQWRVGGGGSDMSDVMIT